MLEICTQPFKGIVCQYFFLCLFWNIFIFDYRGFDKVWNRHLFPFGIHIGDVIVRLMYKIKDVCLQFSVLFHLFSCILKHSCVWFYDWHHIIFHPVTHFIYVCQRTVHLVSCRKKGHIGQAFHIQQLYYCCVRLNQTRIQLNE